MSFEPIAGGPPRVFGSYAISELTTRLQKVKGIKLFDRATLDTLMKGRPFPKTDSSGAVSRFGKALKVDAVIVGTWTDLGDKLKLSVRGVGTKGGRVLATAAATAVVGEGIRKLLGDSAPAAEPAAEAAPLMSPAAQAPPPSSPVRKGDKGVVFDEDFSKVAEGQLPAGWKGADVLAVRLLGRSKALVLTTESRAAKAAALTPSIEFPEDWSIELSASVASHYSKPWVQFEAGDVIVGSSGRKLWFNDRKTGGRESIRLHSEFGDYGVVSLEKSGNVFRVKVNHKQYILKRLSKYEKAQHLRITLFGNLKTVRLHRVRVLETAQQPAP